MHGQHLRDMSHRINQVRSNFWLDLEMAVVKKENVTCIFRLSAHHFPCHSKIKKQIIIMLLWAGTMSHTIRQLWSQNDTGGLSENMNLQLLLHCFSFEICLFFDVSKYLFNNRLLGCRKVRGDVVYM